MRYLPTIDLWAKGIEAAIRAGQLRLQCGQWCKCGAEGKPARFVTLRGGPGGTIWVAHSGNKGTTGSFRSLVKANG